jgi:hypothetical protein
MVNMIEFIDRVPSPNMANKKTIEYADGRVETVTITSADNANPIGTPMNRANLMAIQGFVAKTTRFNADGSITEVNGNNETLTTKSNADGSITETFVGKKTITKTTKFNTDGSITEVIS